jgi:hypothetical protein
MITKYLPFYFLIFFLGVSTALEAQVNPRYQSMGRGTMASQAQIPQEKEQPKTAEELVEAEMPKINEVVEFSDFEQAILRSILTKYVQQRIEVQILNLGPEKTREAYEIIHRNQEEELKASLPEEKYNALKSYFENGGKKPKDKKRKKKKNKS